MKQIHVTVSGLVQGVFFRDSTCRTARQLGLRGYVKNTSDGNVEIVVQGSEKELGELVYFCNRGPSAAQVEKVDVKYEEVKDIFDSFDVRY